MKDDSHSGSRPTQPPSAPDERLFSEPFQDAEGEIAPQPFGRFLIQKMIGRGGMGIVYLAEQKEPFVRQVALKFIRRASLGKSVIRRFNLERQALALMNHENIARVYDADTTEDGQPFFVMEYVPGERMDRFCDGRQMNVAQRLDLFVQVGQAIQHAHQKGIIHRDIKPSNILVMEVDGRIVPKVIDFGVVKPFEGQISDESLHTEQGRLMGTPQYMSPEQLAMGDSDVDTRADVYSLGALLYESLTGVLPFGQKFENIYQLIVHARKTDPLLASQRVRELGEKGPEIAKARGTDLRTLQEQLKGDLDWILRKALAKERDDRYPTVTSLVDDIQRHLRNQPVSAGKPTYTYLLSKFIKRHKVAFFSAVLAGISLVTASIGTTYAMLQAQKAEADANIQRQRALSALAQSEIAERRANTVNQFLTNMLSSADPAELGREVRVTDVLEKASQDAQQSFAEDPVGEVGVRRAIAQTYLGLGQYSKAQAEIEQALNRAERDLGPTHTDTLATLEDKAIALFYQGEYAKSEPIYREILEKWQALPGDNQEQILHVENDLGMVIKFQGRLEEAIPIYREVLAQRTQRYGEDDGLTIESMNNLAMALKSPEHWAEAESLMRVVFQKVRKVKGENHPWTLATLNNLAHLLAERGDYRESIIFHREALKRRTEVLGPNHPQTYQSMSALSSALAITEQFPEAIQLGEAALAGREQVLKPDHIDTLINALELAETYNDAGNPQKALALLETKKAAVLKAFADKPNRLVQFWREQTAGYLFQHKAEKAQITWDQARAIMKSVDRRPPWQDAVTQAYDSWLNWERGEVKALAQIYQAADRLEPELEGAESHYVRLQRLLIQLEHQANHTERAQELRKKLDSRWPAARTESTSFAD
ncbi:MAG: serine/threonine protein kinase [Acidobacteria bacterium]|nr:serine/threonine protein kinase [Acidobacteriota bacterium]MCB9398498.1 serine/threonine protein kinase [Acidobacteriota bacterium]